MALARLGQLRRTWSTVRHLRISQIAYRALRQVRHPCVEDGEPPTLRTVVRAADEPATRAVSLVAPDSFSMLGQHGRIDSPAAWNDPTRDKLWLYHCHYFEDLLAPQRRDRQTWHEALIERWIDENPPAAGNGWEPYPVSLRISSWVLWSRLGGHLDRQ